MSVLFQLKDIRKSYGPLTLLDGASGSFSSYQKVGLIGRNGAGKSTLCKIILGFEEPDSGRIIKNTELNLGYLEQHDPYKEDETVLGFLLRYTGREEWECGAMAGRFQLKNELLESAIGSLPGGYKTRVKLTAMLLAEPNFLILDEPTNYLDLSTLIILENFLQDFNGGFFIVSHDREFLKRTCDHTLEVEHGRLTLYPGGIEEYFEFKDEHRRQISAYNRGVEKKKAQLQDFVDRFRAKASTATRAKSKLKQIQKLKTIAIDHAGATVNIQIPRVECKAGPALTVDSLAIGYPGKKVAGGISLEIERGSKVAVLGDNGQGKTTFLRTIAGGLSPLAGEFQWRGSPKIAYYAQHVFSSLHPDDSVLSHLQREAADGVTRQEILDLAGSFLFRGEEVDKKISVLSGGERARLILAGLLLSRSHVLLFDEPTNHLDFETVEALGRALKSFQGSVFFVSHDRTFVNLIATCILEVKEGRVVRYPGNYEEYVYHLETSSREPVIGSDSSPQKTPASQKRASGIPENPPNDKGTKFRRAEKEASSKKPGAVRRKVKADLNKLQLKMAKVETRIENLSREKDRLLAEIRANPFFYSRQRNEKLSAVTHSLEEEEDLWLQLQEKQEKLKRKLQDSPQ